MDASQPLSITNGNNAFNIAQDRRKTNEYFKQLCQSWSLTYLKSKCFDENNWKSAFCSSSFEFINKYPNLILIYRTLLFGLTMFDLIHGIVLIRPIHEWPIYYTHLTLLITFLAILFQFIITYRVNFYRGNDIVPRHSLQYIHIVLILISLGSGLATCLIYWTIIHNSTMRLLSIKLIVDHGILWLLFFIDIFIFTRLPIYMIDCIPSIIFAFIYGIFTLIIFLMKTKFSKNRLGYVYHAFNFNNLSLNMSIQFVLFIFFVPCGVMFILWNLFFLRGSIQVKTIEEKTDEESNSNIIV
jgi:hypothetical protein